MPNPVPAAVTGLPHHLAARMSKGDEFLRLMDQRRLIDARLSELAEHFGAVPADAPRLPKSGLRLASLAFTGGRTHG